MPLTPLGAETLPLQPPPPAALTGKAGSRRSLIGLSRPALQDLLAETLDVPLRQQPMRIRQLWHWVYRRGCRDFDAMTDIAAGLRQDLHRHFTLARPAIVSEQISRDGVRKWLLRLEPDHKGRVHEIETVFIPEEDRGTLCISSQVGCALSCRFCHTGTQRLVRNLTAGEIVSQLMIARDRLEDWESCIRSGTRTAEPAGARRRITNVVFMGMGEPLYNLGNVAQAIDIIADDAGISLSRRRITVSTAGVAPQIVPTGEQTAAMLAVSLHATTDDQRDALIPLNRKYPLDALLAACRAYPGLSNARRITFEYVMLKGVNDRLADARRLVKLLSGIPAKVNIIPFNPWPGAPYACSAWPDIARFGDLLNAAGYASPVRRPRGQDIMAACGQLRSASLPLSRPRHLPVGGPEETPLPA